MTDKTMTSDERPAKLVVAMTAPRCALSRATPGPGRPALPPGQRRDVELRVRLRPAEIDALDALAARRGVSRSDAVREALRRAARSDAVREVLRHAAIQTT